MLGVGVSAMVVGTYTSGMEEIAQFKKTAEQCSTTISEVVEDPSITAETARRVIPISDDSTGTMDSPDINVPTEDGSSDSTAKSARLTA